MKRLVYFVLILLTGFLSASAVAKAASREAYFSFRGEQFDNDLLVPLGRGTVRLFRPRPEGLLFQLPAGHKLPALGVSPRFQIQGDFEITATYEVPAWKDPKAGYGQGPSLYLKLQDANESAVALGRLLRPGKKHVFSTMLSTTVDEKRSYDVQLYDTRVDSGKLKLVREGGMLTFLVTEKSPDEFRELRQVELGTGDVELLRLGAQQSDPDTPVQVLWKDLTIKAAGFPNHPDTLARGEQLHVPTYHPAPQPEAFSLYWSLAAGIALVLVIGGVVWVRKRG
ncbi:hypothetical protein Pan153_16250 [Gimesia panareensis]|uniref:DUF1583 domain-containing protein n=1 Tax=Gimesia panareensis TaxID=2527978 RepID=A0A518FKW0_9PLAN|nr:DUF1583 domain-containing protein [Gimesia panareensis]QDV16991.1 hypothetical protein Pan153_16250 [Gimesia panareensis]